MKNVEQKYKKYVPLAERQNNVRLRLVASMAPPKRGMALLHPMLGLMPDTEVAKDLGCVKDTVRKAREQLNIPTFNRHAGKRERVLAQPDLETATSKEIAERLGLSYSFINQVRRDEGIVVRGRRGVRHDAPLSELSKTLNNWRR